LLHKFPTTLTARQLGEKNVYLAGYRVGNLDTIGRMVFFNIDQLETGDVITLEDGSGGTYTHEVSEIFVVDPDADWAIDSVRGRDLMMLQTCTYPTSENRIVVRADRV
jgi:LPXTG-site transpeptidase (sortase) family protein